MEVEAEEEEVGSDGLRELCLLVKLLGADSFSISDVVDLVSLE